MINESLSHLRRQKNHLGLDAIAVAAPSSPYFESDALLEALHDAVNRLPEKQRLTFQLRYFDENPSPKSPTSSEPPSVASKPTTTTQRKRSKNIFSH